MKMSDKQPKDYNLQYFTATILKDGKCTIPVEKRDLFNVNVGEVWLLQLVRKMQEAPHE